MGTKYTETTVPDQPTASIGFGTLTGQISRSELFDVLSHERRRCALYYLQQQEGVVELGEVVDYVTAWQYDRPITELPSDERMRVYSALHQVHLPKLDAVGFIEYDSDAGTIEVNEEAEYAKLYLEYDPGNDISWSSLYLGLTGVGALLATVSQQAIYPFDWLGASLLIWIVLTMFALAGVIHTIHNWRNKQAMETLFQVRQ